MKEGLLVLAFVVSGLFVNAQVFVKNVNINKLRNVKYIEISQVNTPFTRKVRIKINYGQRKRSNKHTLLRSGLRGKFMKFNGMIDALNYLDSMGWEYMDSYTLQDGDQFVSRMVLRRKDPYYNTASE